jgi:hypothetical protein
MNSLVVCSNSSFLGLKLSVRCAALDSEHKGIDIGPGKENSQSRVQRKGHIQITENPIFDTREDSIPGNAADRHGSRSCGK